MNLGDRFRLAWRNLLRNRRRSMVTIVSLACGFTAVALFAGYTDSTYTALSNSAIHGELIGHLKINRTGWETQGKLHPDKYLLSAEEIAKVRALVALRIPGAVLVPKLGVSGLLSNGSTSTIFAATGIAPADLDLLRGPYRNGPGALHADKPAGVTLAQGLADMLNLNMGASASILSNTVHAQANAADADVTDTVDTGNIATNDKLMLMPLAMAQSLLDAPQRAESLTLLLPSDGPGGAGGERVNIAALKAPDEAQTSKLAAQLGADFTQAGMQLDVQTWQQISAFYNQVKSMYDMIFALMLGVVLAIVALSIANAMGMAVVERTREIGTLRAIGLRRGGIIALFVCEALLLVLIGIAASLLLTVLIRNGINAANIRFTPPGNTSSVPVYIGFDMLRTAGAGLLLVVLTFFAALVPARRASRQPITEALGHV